MPVTSIAIENATLEYYPNPIADRLTISSDRLMKRVDVINSIGVTMVSKTVNDTNAVIDLTAYESGPYLLRIYYTDNGTVFKVVKQ